MVKYSSFLLTASIWAFIALYVSATYTAAAQGTTTETDADPFNGNMETAFQALSNIETSSNPFIIFFRDTAKKYIDYFERDKQFIQDAVTKGTEMEKKIQSISDNLQNSNVTLPAELQSELEETEKHAAAELTKLKELEDVKDIEEMHKGYNAKYTEIKKQIEELSTVALAEIEKGKQAAGGTGSSSSSTSSSGSSTGSSSSSGSSAQTSNQFPPEAKTKLIAFITTSVPVALTISKDTEAISKKIEATTSALSNIRDDLIKVEQIQYHFLRAHKDLFKTDFASLTRSSMAQFAVAIMFGILF